ncbi:hypothetical protein ELH84_15505 [Rhizobium ruizarguesonis]|nr:hypothetical protein ELH84_15505 [Rhizobium ruizarguesonis]
MARDVDDVLVRLVICHLSPEELEEAEADWTHESQFMPKMLSAVIRTLGREFDVRSEKHRLPATRNGGRCDQCAISTAWRTRIGLANGLRTSRA